jgi:hypothetical protein
LYSQFQERPLSFTTAETLMNRVDQLNYVPKWFTQELKVEGIVTHEPLMLYLRDITECVKELFGNPKFSSYMDYAPRKVWEDNSKSKQITSGIATAKWWERVQASAFKTLFLASTPTTSNFPSHNTK